MIKCIQNLFRRINEDNQEIFEIREIMRRHLLYYIFKYLKYER